MPAMRDIRPASRSGLPAAGEAVPGETAALVQGRGCPPWIGVLGWFYQHAESPVPSADRLPSEDLPEPYRHLLVHNRDMTATLERFHGSPVRLTVCSRFREGNLYLREVVLSKATNSKPVEYGVIAIHLERFSDRGQALILSEEHPFGRILQMEEMAYIGWPQAFFRIRSDARMAGLLLLPAPASLFGRRNVILDGDRRLLAEVIEILSPAEGNRPIQNEPDGNNAIL
jgi:chorismate-pyruvate lyase